MNSRLLSWETTPSTEKWWPIFSSSFLFLPSFPPFFRPTREKRREERGRKREDSTGYRQEIFGRDVNVNGQRSILIYTRARMHAR